MVNHGISTGALFLLFGVIYDRRHTRQHRRVRRPRQADAGLRGALRHRDARERRPARDQRLHRRVHGHHRHVRLDTLGHFNGIQAVGAAIGVILGAIYMLSVVQKMFFGPLTKKENQQPARHQRRASSSRSRRSSMMIFVIGLFPNVFLSQIKDAAARVRERLRRASRSNPAPDVLRRARSSSLPRTPGAPPPAPTAAAADRPRQRRQSH